MSTKRKLNSLSEITNTPGISYPPPKRQRINENNNNYHTLQFNKLNIFTPPNNKHISRVSQIHNKLKSNKYNITYIFGPSGVGKTTLINELKRYNNSQYHILNPNELKWNSNKSVVSHFKNHNKLLNNVGLNSIPSHISDFKYLSEGEKYRVIVARLLKDALYSKTINGIKIDNKKDYYIILDEYTSTLDRDTSFGLCCSLSKCIRQYNKQSSFTKPCKIILCSAHYDIIPYLNPDLFIELLSYNDIKFYENPKSYKNIDTKAILDFNKLPKNIQKWKDNKYKLKSVFDDNENEFNHGRKWSKLNQTIVLEHCVEIDPWTEKTSLIYDYTFEGINKTETVNVTAKEIENQKSNIFVLFGHSGCGKTTNAKRLVEELNIPQYQQLYDTEREYLSEDIKFEDAFNENNEFEDAFEDKYNQIKWDKHTIVQDKFRTGSIKSKLIMEAVNLNASFLNRKYFTLSFGERHRVDIGVTLSYICKEKHKLRKQWFIIDEFTSYLDRPCAMRVANGVNNFIKTNKLSQIFILSCHYDIVPLIDNANIINLLHQTISIYSSANTQKRSTTHYINPNIYKNNYKFDNNMFSQPKIRIIIKPCPSFDFKIFSKWHYKTRKIEKHALCLGAWITYNDKLNGESDIKMVGFTSIIGSHPSVKKLGADYSLHRTVVLPRYQSLGIGSRISESMAEYLLRQKPSIRLHSKTAHPFYGKNRGKNLLWNPCKCNGTMRELNQGWFGDKNKNKTEKKMYYSNIYNSLETRDKNHKILDKLKQRLIIIEKDQEFNDWEY